MYLIQCIDGVFRPAIVKNEFYTNMTDEQLKKWATDSGKKAREILYGRGNK